MKNIYVGILFLTCLSASVLCAADDFTYYPVTDASRVEESDIVMEVDGQLYGCRRVAQQPYRPYVPGELQRKIALQERMDKQLQEYRDKQRDLFRKNRQ